MQEKYRKICQILNLPTHAILVSTEGDTNGVPYCIPYEMNDASALLKIIRTLDKEFKMCEDREMPTHIYRVLLEKDEECHYIEAISVNKVREDFEKRGHKVTKIYEVDKNGKERIK